MKTYDELFAAARSAYGSGAYDDATFEFLFPELRESEDERIRAEIVGFLNSFCPSYIPEREIKDLFQRKRFGDWVAWLEKQKERGPLTKVEEYRLNRIIEYLEDEGGHSDWVELLQDIRNLPYQKEQKPAEWSEEDEDMLNRCISSIDEAKENRYAYKETDGDTSYDEEMDWLKSLRPHWKPSEEQMEALNALNLYGDLSYVGQQNQLISLYQDLKKLM